ncbi:MAG: ABC transporter substrate-binding protein [Streptosporangiaceae bacterium]
MRFHLHLQSPRIYVGTAILTAVALGAAACSGSLGSTGQSSPPAGGSGSAKYGGTLSAATNGSGPWSPVFNPFSPSYNYAFGVGAIYESLYMYNGATKQNVPWLATSYKWSSGGKAITFSIRKGVKWSNGKPFTPADVVFTFDLVKKITAENHGTNQLLSATAHGDSIVLQYNSPQYVNFPAIAYNTPIVPPFTFAGVSDPVKFEDQHPIGTGPFILQSVSSQYITYQRNPHYWQKGKPYISTVRDVSADSNSSMEAMLIANTIQFSGVFTADIKKTFADRSPARNIVYTPANGTISLALNQADPLFRNIDLRMGISYAIDRNRLSTIGEAGAELPASPSGLSGTPATSFITPAYQSPVTQNLAKARAILRQGGFVMKGSSLVDAKTNQKVAFSLEFPGSYSDWMTDCSIITQDLSSVGIAVTCSGVSYQRWSADTGTGKFQATFDAAPGPAAYQEMSQVFAVPSGGLPAVGQSNGYVNIERYSSPAAVSALSAIESTNPSDQAALQKQYDVLEQIMAKDLPVIPLFTSTYHADFINGPLYGWPSASDPYLCVACNAAQEQLLLSVHQK